MNTSNDMITNVGKNSNDTAALVWSVADDLVGAYKPQVLLKILMISVTLNGLKVN